MCYVSSATDMPNLNFPRVVWTGLLWLCLTRPTLHVGSRWAGVTRHVCVLKGGCLKKTYIKTPFLVSHSSSVYSREIPREDPQQQWPLIKGSEHSFALTEVSRWSFDEYTLCTNSDCRTLSFQVFENLHLPVILSNNFLILSLSLSDSFSSSAKWSNIIFWIKTCGWCQIPHVTVFHVRLSCLVSSSALYEQTGCGCVCGHVVSTSEGQLWGSSLSLT